MGFTSALVFYMIPGFLGRAYNVDKHSVGPDLFTATEITRAQKVLQQYITTSEYKLVSDLDEAKDFLDVSGSLALKLKNGDINVEGAGSYIKQASSFHKKVELLIKVHYETETVMLDSYAKPHEDYKTFLKSSPGNTHYIRSITYGGNLVASVSFLANTKSDLEKIKGTLQAGLQSKSGSFSGSLKGELSKIENVTKDSSSISINYFATVPLKTIPKNMEELVALVEDFPNQAKKVNNGRGVPIQMEVFTLRGLDPSFDIHYESPIFTNKLAIVDEQISDLKRTRRRLNDWMQTIPPTLSSPLNQKIADFNTNMQETSKAFDKLVNTLQVNEKGQLSQFDEAFQKYKEAPSGTKETAFPDLYLKELSKLKLHVLSQVDGLETDFGGVIYTHWGDNSCPSGTEKVEGSEGLMASTVRQAVGTTQFLCLPEKRDNQDEEDVFESADDEETPFDFLPEINRTLFKSRKDDPSKVYSVKCALCRIKGKTAVTMFPGRTACPREPNWSMQYSGVLVSTDFKSVRSELVCLHQTANMAQVEEDKELTVVTEVSMSKNPGEALSCVVCNYKNAPVSRSGALNLL